VAKELEANRAHVISRFINDMMNGFMFAVIDGPISITYFKKVNNQFFYSNCISHFAKNQKTILFFSEKLYQVKRSVVVPSRIMMPLALGCVLQCFGCCLVDKNVILQNHPEVFWTNKS
jgi:ABC-type multidrug transport system permease subunit